MCLQELKAPDDKFPAAELAAAGYHSIWMGQSRWNGVAILRKDAPLQARQKGLAGDPEDVQSRYIETEIEDLILAGLYLPNGNPAPGPKYDYKLGWMSRLQKRMAELQEQSQAIVVCGDFNVIP